MSERPEVSELEIGPGLPTLRIGSGPRTLVYFPGLSLHPGVPTANERRMAATGWDALLPDHSIYRIGRRVRPVGTSFADMAEDAIAAIDELGPPIDVMGASTGGMLALHVAAARPDLIRRLVLVISGATMSEHGRALGRHALDAASAGRWRTVYSLIMSIGASTGRRRAMYSALGWLLGPRLIGVPTDPTLFLAELDALLRADVVPPLDGMTRPALLIGGANDQVFPPEIVEATARRLPHATATILPGLAHDFPSWLTADHIAPFLLQPDLA